MIATVQIMTADELLQMPDDGMRHELVKGELRTMAPAGNEHGRVTVRLTWRLASHVETNNLGAVYAAETGFWTSRHPDTVRAPDIAFVRQQRLDEVGRIAGFWPGAPDLAVEVVSPSESFADVEEDALDWLDAGTAVVLVVNPRNRTVTAYRSQDDISIFPESASIDLSDVVPGFQIAVREIFE